jgi:prostaglandin-E synthase
MTSNTAPIKWAQRSDSLYITIALSDVKDETIDLTDSELHFKGTSEDKPYEVNIKFYQPIDSKNTESTYKVLPRSVQMHVMKVVKEEDKDDDEEEFWPRLLEDKTLEKNQVKIDWDRYVDEDEEEEGFDTSNLEGGMGMGGPGGMPGMGGPGGMPGMEGMGGMPGMEGMGGMGGMDMEALMKQMGGMGGMGGMPDMGDMAGMGGMPGMGGADQEADSDDDDEEDLPDLE